jgi:hypothetical protein
MEKLSALTQQCANPLNVINTTTRLAAQNGGCHGSGARLYGPLQACDRISGSLGRTIRSRKFSTASLRSSSSADSSPSGTSSSSAAAEPSAISWVSATEAFTLSPASSNTRMIVCTYQALDGANLRTLGDLAHQVCAEMVVGSGGQESQQLLHDELYVHGVGMRNSRSSCGRVCNIDK